MVEEKYWVLSDKKRKNAIESSEVFFGKFLIFVP